MATKNTRAIPGRSFYVLAGIAALMVLLLAGCAPARYGSSHYDDTEMDDVEYLSSYGSWVYLPAYGMVWSPDVVAGWQPFYYGHWLRTADGWAWASYEPYGWLVYHYGFWGFRPDIGWFWVPGDTWYPARVEWYTFGDYTGWAPIPPPGIVWVDPWIPYDVDVWVVIDVDDFTSDNVGRYRVERSIYRDRIERGTAAARAPYVHEIESATRRRVPVVEVEEQPSYVRLRKTYERKAADDRSVRRETESAERTVEKQTASDKRSETGLKKMTLPAVEKRRVEKHAPRVEKEVLKRRKKEEPAKRSSEESRDKRSSEDGQDTTRNGRK